MTNVMKKISALLLSFALIMTMMPLLAVEANAESNETAFEFYVNNHKLGEVSTTQMEALSGEPQIYPWLASKGANVGYYVVKGATYDSVLREFYGAGLEELPGNTVVTWRTLAKNSTELDKTDYGNSLTVDELKKFKTLFKLVDADGTDYTKTLKKNVASYQIFASRINDSAEPVIALYREAFLEVDSDVEETAYVKAQKSEAFTNLKNWEAENKVANDSNVNSPVINHIGGNMEITEPLYLYKETEGTEGTWSANDASKNFVGKYAAQQIRHMRVNTTLTPATETVTLTAGETKDATADLGVGEGMSKKLLEYASWTTDSDKVATAKEGKITAVASGTCTLTAKLDDEVIATFNVTVKEAEKRPAVTDGQTATVGGNGYKVLSAKAGTAAFTKAANKKSVTVPDTVKINGKTLKVTQINAGAFKGKKIKTVTVGKNVNKIAKNALKGSKATKMIVKTKNLKKASVKGSLKGSKIKTVQVKVGKKKENKKYLKKYKKIFTKKNAGKKVKIK